MEITINTIALLSYMFYAYSLLRCKEISLNMTTGVFLCISLFYGPHTVMFEQFYRESSLSVLDEKVGMHYAALMILTYIVFGAVNFSTNHKLLTVGSWQGAFKKKSGGGIANLIVLIVSALFIAISILLQSGWTITAEHLKYLIGLSDYSYNEIRRELYDGSVWGKYAAQIRFSIIPILYGYMLTLSMLEKSRYRVFYILIAISLPIITSIQLNKFFYIYYLFLTASILYMCLSKKSLVFNVSIKNLKFYAGSFFVFGVVIIMLYLMQYSSALSGGSLSLAQMIDTIIYRAFFASADALRLWIDYFYYQYHPAGLQSVGKVCELFFDECVNVNTLIPYHYAEAINTSMQSGFLGSIYSVWGVFSGPLIITFVALMTVANNFLLSKVNYSLLGLVAAPVMFMSAYFITTSELNTAILSGGGVFNAVCIYILHLFINKEKSDEIDSIS
ncbi:hypothetical protein [uncultured Kushneria sp.]|uniref:hypothetical protein n=1 Tax=uncultured Kushneria sp. TaxID=905033 RepID=UPI00262D4A68|nr:hypothetical protein [uncultured Kushneria sp.]